MSISETSICNKALTLLGANRISSIDDDSIEAKLCKDHFADVRDDLLRSHPWKFALKRALLAASSTAPAWGWLYEYPLPSDCLRVVEMLGQEQDNWTEEGRSILTDSEIASIKYIQRIESVGIFDSNFATVLSIDLALVLAYALTTSQGLRTDLATLRKEKIKEARTFSAQSAVGDRVYADDWLNSRW